MTINDDSVSCIINAAICALREVYAPDSESPPLGGGSGEVRFFAGDAPGNELWDAHYAGCGCDKPFLWVRLMRRYRTLDFPNEYVGPSNCGHPKAIALELGVARCASMEVETSWEVRQQEAKFALDDSWRIELAMCRAGARAMASNCADNFALDAIIPAGPEGGVISWLGTAYFQIG
jgi:hypothetical protein